MFQIKAQFSANAHAAGSRHTERCGNKSSEPTGSGVVESGEATGGSHRPKQPDIKAGQVQGARLSRLRVTFF